MAAGGKNRAAATGMVIAPSSKSWLPCTKAAALAHTSATEATLARCWWMLETAARKSSASDASMGIGRA